MTLPCTRCHTSGFLNLHALPVSVAAAFERSSDHGRVLDWLDKASVTDVRVCDCCGDGRHWYGVPGEHYNAEDPVGAGGPYQYNGGLCECH